MGILVKVDTVFYLFEFEKDLLYFDSGFIQKCEKIQKKNTYCLFDTVIIFHHSS